MKLLRSPWIRLAIFGLFCLGVIVASQVSWDSSYRTASGVPRSYAPFGDEIRRSDGSVDYRATLNRLLGEPPPPEENAAVVFATLAGRGELSDSRLRAQLFDLIGLSEPRYAAGQSFFDEYKQAENTNQNANDSIWKYENEHLEMAAWLDRYPAEIAQLRAACHLKWYVPLVNSDSTSPLAADLLPLAQSARTGARMLVSDAFREAGRGNVDAAVADLVAVYQLGLNSTGPIIVQDLIGIAIRGMGISAAEKLVSQFALTEEQLRALADGFQQESSPQVFQPEKGRGERYMLLDLLQGIERRQYPSATPGQLLSSSDPFANLLGFGFGPFVDRGAVLHYYNLEQDSLSRWQRLSELQGSALAEMLKPLKPNHSLAALPSGVKGADELNASFWVGTIFSPTIRGQRLAAHLINFGIPASAQTAAATIRIAQQRRLLELAIALERYHRVQRTYPDSLEQLVPEFLAKLPIDQFAERGPFGYQKLENGFRVFAHPNKPQGLPRWPDYSFEIAIERSGKKPEEPGR